MLRPRSRAHAKRSASPLRNEPAPAFRRYVFAERTQFFEATCQLPNELFAHRLTGQLKKQTHLRMNRGWLRNENFVERRGNLGMIVQWRQLAPGW